MLSAKLVRIAYQVSQEGDLNADSFCGEYCSGSVYTCYTGIYAEKEEKVRKYKCLSLAAAFDHERDLNYLQLFEI